MPINASLGCEVLLGLVWRVLLPVSVKVVPGRSWTPPASLSAEGRGCGRRIRLRVAAWSSTAEALSETAYLLDMAAVLMPKVSCPAIHLPACGRSEPSAILYTLCVQRLAPGAVPRPTRG